MHPAQPPHRPATPEGFHTVAEALRAAARQIETTRDEATQKLHLPPPPDDFVLGDARAAEDLRTSIGLHNSTGRWAIAEMDAMVPQLRASADGYTDTEDTNTDYLTAGTRDPGTPRPGAQHSGAQHLGAARSQGQV